MSRRRALSITLGVVALECLALAACSYSEHITPNTSFSVTPNIPNGALDLPPEEVARRVQIQIKVTDVR